MRRFRLSTVTLAVLLGLPALVHAQDADTATKGSWFSRLLPGNSQPAGKPKDEKADKAAADEKRAAATKALAATTRVREKDNWLRRLKVCDKLTDIAIMNHDDELLRKAEHLSQRAFAMYMQRANLPAGSYGPMADERLLDQRLGSRTSVGQNLLTTSPTANTGQASLPGGRQ